MSDLLNLHLFHQKQWKDAETGPLLLDRQISDWSKSLCSEESICQPVIKFLTETTSAKLTFALVVGIFLWKASTHLGHKKQKLMLFFLSLSIGIGDFLSNQLKYIFLRMRPDHDMDLFYRGTIPSYSLPSNHAFNMVTLSWLLWLLYSKGYTRGVKFPIVITIIAFLVSISRVFIGRHYPLDVVASLFFGTFYALLIFTLARKFRARDNAR